MERYSIINCTANSFEIYVLRFFLIILNQGVIELAIAEGASLKIEKLTTKNGVKSISNAEIVFYDYNADAFLLEDSTLTAEDDKLYIPSVDSYIKLTAYDEAGNLLVGD